MKIIYISWSTWSGKTTALRSLVGKENIFWWTLTFSVKVLDWVKALWIDWYRWEKIPDEVIRYLSAQWVTHIYIATEKVPSFDN